MRNIRIACLLLLIPLWIGAQQGKESIEGIVSEIDEHGHSHPLVGANVYWLGTTRGTITDAQGTFTLQQEKGVDRLVVSFVGYQSDTIGVDSGDRLQIQLNPAVALDEVEVAHRRKSTELSRLDAINVHNIGEEELQKAACCNLSESFETNPSVDVSFTDAVTGTRQIQMLGLAGPYTQITRENMPDIRGLSAIQGLTYIPGTWIESIQLNKGAGSVVNGYESIAGQINTELRKPETADRMYLNAFVNEEGRVEGNANFAHRFKDSNWSTGLLLHAKDHSHKADRNEDGFLDHPLGNTYIGLNRWKYLGNQGFRMQFGVKGTYIDNFGGQTGFSPEGEAPVTEYWGMEMKTQRFEGWAKFGYLSEVFPWRSAALQISGVTHQQDSYFGLNQYDADQQSLYANFIYQSILSNTQHKFKTGISLQYDDFNEALNDTIFAYTEIIPGAYFEYTYDSEGKFSAVAGIRADYHNLYGAFITPRLHMRYAITENTIFRASGGRGQRTASIIAENTGLLASSRQIMIQGEDNDKPYGLDPEVAWNYGVNIAQHFRLNQRQGVVSIDFYRTDFENQIIVDLDQSPQTAAFYNLDGESFSNSLQAQIDYEILPRFDVRLAYRRYDVQATYSGEIKQKPLMASDRAFINLAYETRNQWKFDYTINWQGQKRIPNTAGNPVEYQLPDYSPDFFLMNAQVSKAWGSKFEIYAGAENLLNYKQDDPILASDEPFGPYFDSSLIWGPVFGRNLYMGLRFFIE